MFDFFLHWNLVNECQSESVLIIYNLCIVIDTKEILRIHRIVFAFQQNRKWLCVREKSFYMYNIHKDDHSYRLNDGQSQMQINSKTSMCRCFNVDRSCFTEERNKKKSKCGKIIWRNESINKLIVVVERVCLYIDRFRLTFFFSSLFRILGLLILDIWLLAIFGFKKKNSISKLLFQNRMCSNKNIHTLPKPVKFEFAPKCKCFYFNNIVFDSFTDIREKKFDW